MPCSRHWEHSREQTKDPFPHGGRDILVGEKDNSEEEKKNAGKGVGRG